MNGGWDQLAEHIGRIVELEKRIADLERRLRPLAPLPWRVSAWGNVVDAGGAIIVRFYGPTRRDRKAQAGPYLRRYLQQRADMEAELRARRVEIDTLKPAEPGKLFGALDVPDLRRVTAAQIAEAMNLANGDAVRAEVLPDGVISIVPGRLIEQGAVLRFVGRGGGDVRRDEQVRQLDALRAQERGS